VVAVGSLAGCLGAQDGVRTTTEEGTGGDASTTEATPLDLREANVVDVAVESADGRYTFDVTLHHDDDGEDGYANWWQVERLDGTRLGRRDLLHAHSQQPFTRSATVDVPADVTCVVVRSHDETHGYGGHAMTVDIQSGSVRAIDQGPEPRAMEESDCP
jgi:hypothetical protein